MEIAILGLGCFWGPEIKFSKLEGVVKTEVGYCGGDSKETTYKEVCTGNTNHAEVVKLDFDSKIISYEKILDFFFKISFNNCSCLDDSCLISNLAKLIPKHLTLLIKSNKSELAIC